MTYSIKHLFHINASKAKVFDAISTINGISHWWANETSGNDSQNGIIQIRFGEWGGPDMKVIELKTNEKVEWQCVQSNHGWVGNTFQFVLDDNDGKTRVRFSHDLWTENGDFYASCCFTWGRYLESLRQYCQTGRGEAFGSEGYRK